MQAKVAATNEIDSQPFRPCMIMVHPDASMTVSETIRVICARDQIKRGIIREFPTTYKDHYGHRINVGFEVLEVLRDGRKIMDRIEGFILFLSVAKKDRLNFRNPPDKTTELFERFLPYALALGVEQQWSEQFADVLAAAARDGNYKPAWYSGHNWNSGNIGGFASNLGSSFTGAISSASTAPGSSSGSGGGGFSGGGGGGGGGSGW